MRRETKRVSVCMVCSFAALFLASEPANARYVPIPGDYIVASRDQGTIYAVDPSTGLIRDLITGPDLRIGMPPMPRGSGPMLRSHQTDLAMNSQHTLLARVSPTEPPYFGLVEVDLETGNRTVVEASQSPEWNDAGGVVFTRRREAHVLADGFDHMGDGRLLRYDLDNNVTTVVSSAQVGDGPVFYYPRFLCSMSNNAIAVLDWAIQSECGLFAINRTTGDRTFLSRLSRQNILRPYIDNGVSVGNVVLGDDEGGVGPVINEGTRALIFFRNRMFVGGTVDTPAGYLGTILEVNPVTGDRTLLAGSAYVDNGLANTLIDAPASKGINIDAPCGFALTSRGTIAFVLLFAPSKIYELNVDTGALVEIADIAAQLRSGTATGFNSLVIVPHPADINGDQRVDASDLSVLLAQFGQTGSNLLADVNVDHVVNGADLTVLLASFGWGVE